MKIPLPAEQFNRSNQMVAKMLVSKFIQRKHTELAHKKTGCK